MRLNARRPLVLALSAALLVSAFTMTEALAATPTYVRICKITSAPNLATGSFTFNVDEVVPTTPLTPTRTVTVPVGGCSANVEVAGGQQVRVVEQASANSSLAAVTVSGTGTLVSTNLVTRTAIVTAPSSVTAVLFRNQGVVPPAPACTTPPPAPAASTTAFVLDLKTGFAGTFGSQGVTGPMPAWVSYHTPPVALTGAHAGWNRTALKINLAGYCKANIVVEYEGQPSDWTVDIGDSPTNDGYGGDAGTTVNEAEVQVVNNSLGLYSREQPTGPVLLETDTFNLKDGALKFVVSNGALTWGQPSKARVDSNLFAIPDTTSTDGSSIYAAFNSVVSQRADRVGHGARRVMITLQ